MFFSIFPDDSSRPPLDSPTSEASVSTISTVLSYDERLSQMPVQRIGNKLRLLPLPCDNPLTVSLPPSDLFTDEQIKEHNIQTPFWTLDFSDLPEFLIDGIQQNNTELERKRRMDKEDEGDRSGRYGAVWGDRKRRC
jgi:hypothetical protein